MPSGCGQFGVVKWRVVHEVDFYHNRVNILASGRFFFNQVDFADNRVECGTNRVDSEQNRVIFFQPSHFC